MSYFDYGYFKYSNKNIKKFDPKKERTKLSDKRGIINRIKANEFDKEFKKTKSGSRDFFVVYDKFMDEKINDKTDKANSTSTVKRYEYNKKLLQDFEESKGVKLNFNSIDKKFYNELIHYCLSEKKHATNTLSRNIGLFKTFLNWAVLNRYTYKLDFQDFKNIKKEITDEVALTMEQVDEIFNFDFKFCL